MTPSFIHRQDPNPEKTRIDVLRVLNDLTRRGLGAGASMYRREIQGEIFGDKFGASWTIEALRWLHERGYVEHPPSSRQRYWVTAAGRAAVRLIDAMDAEAAS